mmetsp:Transcript_20272/g.40602  ORF Transcript_20272/g.40602 Transcript_20272/m.40602 type:complete len:96 (-) Transcript_20272:129-416(-)
MKHAKRFHGCLYMWKQIIRYMHHACWRQIGRVNKSENITVTVESEKGNLVLFFASLSLPLSLKKDRKNESLLQEATIEADISRVQEDCLRAMTNK